MFNLLIGRKADETLYLLGLQDNHGKGQIIHVPANAGISYSYGRQGREGLASRTKLSIDYISRCGGLAKGAAL